MRPAFASLVLVPALTLSVLAAPDGAPGAASAPEAVREAAAVMLPESALPKQWIQGEPVLKFEAGTTYVFEFWATWCGPCLAAMPHMEALQQHFKDRKDVRIVGVNVFDDTAVAKLKPFLAAKDIKVTYAIGADGDRSGPIAKEWLAPLKVSGIPFALILRDGKVIWTGHPNNLSVETIELTMKSKEEAALSQAKADEVKRQKEELGRKVMSLTEAGKFDELASLLHQIHGDDAEARYKAARNVFAHLVHIDNEERLLAWIRLMGLDFQDDPKVQLSLCDLLLRCESIEKKDPVLMRGLLARHLALTGGKPSDNYWELKAESLLLDGDRAGAIEHFEKALGVHRYAKRAAELRAEAAKEAAAKPAAIPAAAK